MARVMYFALASLDGYVADRDGRFDWAQPDEEVHAFVNDLNRSVGTYLYGRRMYEVMAAWQSMPAEGPAFVTDFAEQWRAADKVVYSTSLAGPVTPRTRVERAFDPDAVRALRDFADRDITVAGPTLAAEAFRAVLVDDVHLLLAPVLVGGGLAALPGGVRLDLALVSERRFANGVVHLHHRIRP